MKAKQLFIISIASIINSHSFYSQNLHQKGFEGKNPAMSYDEIHSSGPGIGGFVENKGQIVDQENKINSGVKFLICSPRFNVQLRQTGLSYDTYLEERKSDPSSKERSTFSIKGSDRGKLSRQYHRVDVEFLNCNANAEILASGKSATYFNYFTEGTPANGINSVHQYQKVEYKNIYPNIDLEFYPVSTSSSKSENSAAIEYQFILHKGANINDIKLQYSGADKVSLNEGQIKVNVTAGTFSEKIPASYLIKDRKNVAVNYVQSGSNTFSFSLPTGFSFDGDLIIDPTPCLNWGSYFGYSYDNSHGVALDKTSNVVIAGYTESSSHIATSGAYQTVMGTGGNTYIAKLNPSGSTLIWGTYYGGNGTDQATGLALDTTGNIYVTGYTGSTTKIATPGAYQTSLLTTYVNSFVAKFNSNGTSLLWGTYYGGTVRDFSEGIAVDDSSNVYITGYTSSTTNIATPGAMKTSKTSSGYNAFVAKFNASGSALKWGTYYGGTGSETGTGIALDNNNNVYITGYSSSSSGISTVGAYQTTYLSGGLSNGYVAKINPTGSTLLWGTYYGGPDDTWPQAIKLDASKNVYITGNTRSTSGIATHGAYDTINRGGPGGNNNGFVAKFNPAGSSLIWGTYYGGPNDDYSTCLALDANNNVYFAGSALSTTNIATPGAYQTTLAGINNNSNSFIAKLSSSGSTLFWGTYYGGTGNPAGSWGDGAVAITLDGSDNVFVTGYTPSSSGIATPGAFKTNYTAGNNQNAFVAMFGCTNLATWLQESNNSEDDLNFYPNPFSVYTTIDIINVQPCSGFLFNTLGQCINSWKLNSGSNKLDMSSLPSGSYYFKIQMQDRIFTKKLIKVD